MSTIEYSIKQLAQLTGVTPRALRYYDQIGLLSPAYINQSGYRIYQQGQVDKLQQILFFREFEISLEQIKAILAEPTTSYLTLLEQHRKALSTKKKRLDALIRTIDQTIASAKGDYHMMNTEKFEAFKKEQVLENEALYGRELQAKYAPEILEQSKKTQLDMSQEDYQLWQETEQELLTLLQTHHTITVPSEAAEKLFQLHKNWLTYSLKNYQGAIHKGIGAMYLADERFTAYYDEKAGSGAASLLNDTIQYYAK